MPTKAKSPKAGSHSRSQSVTLVTTLAFATLLAPADGQPTARSFADNTATVAENINKLPASTKFNEAAEFLMGSANAKGLILDNKRTVYVTTTPHKKGRGLADYNVTLRCFVENIEWLRKAMESITRSISGEEVKVYVSFEDILSLA